MGFRFRRSVKIAPGVRINIGKKGTSLTVGKRGAKVTVGKKGVRTTVGLPGTGISYSKHHSFKEPKKNMNTINQSTSNSVTNTSYNQLSKQQEWNNALKILKWSFFIFLAFIILMMAKDSPTVWFGVIIIIFAAILKYLGKRDVIKLKKTWFITCIGWILTLILWVSGIEPSNPIQTPTPYKPGNNLVTPVNSKKENNNENITEDNSVESETVVNKEINNDENTIIESEPVVQQEYFSNCTELRKVYSSGVPSGHPAYRSKLDRDKDGWACER